MSANLLAKAVAAALEQARISYMVVGSFSSNLYGLPRSTKDADFVVELGDQSISSIMPFLDDGFKLDPQMRLESVTGTCRYVMTHTATQFKVEFFLLTNDAFDQSRFTRRRKGLLDGQQVFVPTAEDVLIQKILWAKRGHRAKDREDALHVLEVMTPEALDLPYIHRWCDTHGTRDLLEQLISEIQT